MRDVSFPLHEKRFPSGLRVILEEDHRTPLVGLFLVVGAGSSSDPQGKEGLAHYVEHLAFRSRPYGKSSLRRLLERAGAAQWNAFTGLDDTVYYEVGPASALPEMLRLEGARMLAPIAKVTPETLAVELEVVANELRQSNETGFVGEMLGAMQAAVFPAGHPYARPVIGTHESLHAITPVDIEAFLKRHYRPDNMTLVILGDIKPAEIGPIVESSLPEALLAAPTPVKPGPRLAPRAPEPPAPPPARLVRKEGAVATPELWIGWSLPRSFDAEAYLVEFMEREVNEQLRGAARADDDIAFVSTELVSGTQASMLLCRVVLNRGGHPERSMERVLDRMHNVWTRPNNATEVQADAMRFDHRKRAAVVNMLLEAEHIGSRGVARATITHFSQDPSLYSRALNNVIALQPRRVADLADRYLNRDRARAVLFTPPAGGGARASAFPVSATALDEEDPLPMRVDEDRLKGIAVPPGVSWYTQLNLPNGLEVVLGRREGLPLVSVGLMLRGGLTAIDPAAAHVAALLAAPRETWHGDPKEFGGQMTVSHMRDRSAYMLQGASGNVGIMLGILAERVRSMDVDSGKWASFERDTVSYLSLTEQQPKMRAERSFLSTLFADHPFGRVVTGKDLGDSSVGAAQRWIDATHTPRNAVLAVIGEIDPTEVEKIVRDQFEGWKDQGPAPAAVTAARMEGEPMAPRFVVTHRPGATQAEVRFGCLLPPTERAAVEVRHDLVGALVENRLGKVLRQQLGATYGIDANAWVLAGGSSFLEVTGAVENGKLGKALATLTGTLTSLAEAPASPGALAEAKLALARHVATAYVTNGDITRSVLGLRLRGYPLQDGDAYGKLLAAVPAEAVQRDFKRCQGGQPTISILGDEVIVRAAIKEASTPAAPASPAPSPPAP
ncbi:M16 family metallopeptidase [Polyangium aurulentum]|uniref:M16 family metallopeptidase n=1 Tax=Polyangium aurulentum TaxID=2567896 RepID=UPI00146F34E8|nr:M16 family metallopeptidase [Polyangium aurulentum]UQA61491.1 insulinase family protein [Polyangium aurulentum]